MDIINRYLQAVKFWLPDSQKADILAELSSDIYAQIEERESELGRPLTQGEVEELLRQRGRPMLVATRYQPQRYLIGPALFPMYVFVLKVVAACFGFTIVARFGLWLVNPALHLWSSLIPSAFMAFGIITVVFAAIDRCHPQRDRRAWEPRNLPRLPDTNLVSRPSSAIEFAVNLAAVFAWCAAYFYSPLNRPDLRITLAPVWPWFFWGFLCAALANTALAAAQFLRPYRTPLRAVLRLLSDCFGSALFCWLLKAHIVAAIYAPALTPQRALATRDLIDLWCARCLPFVVCVAVVIAIVDLVHIFRLRSQKSPQAHQTAMAL